LVVQRIQSDYRSTLETEREHLRSVSGTQLVRFAINLLVAENADATS
jgi:hypothetical protein